ncbi:hypothetical protein BpHYR1_016532 [Brachionus plicatilis]|uniref:Uncharacterized protein n=1 Tax=Brachionus plicatilis TaxID=10195 RepID=A0A3M7R7G2_BRAPC|nr:hypothetical protein BpHYR1_016532 [Brachionus plicatilis]
MKINENQTRLISNGKKLFAKTLSIYLASMAQFFQTYFQAISLVILDPEEGHFGRNASINKMISFLSITENYYYIFKDYII